MFWNFEVGQEYYQAMVLVNGIAIDCECEYFASFDDAKEDGEYQAALHDPVLQEKNPGCVSVVVRKYRVTEINGDDFTSESIGFTKICSEPLD